MNTSSLQTFGEFLRCLDPDCLVVNRNGEYWSPDNLLDNSSNEDLDAPTSDEWKVLNVREWYRSRIAQVAYLDNGQFLLVHPNGADELFDSVDELMSAFPNCDLVLMLAALDRE